MARLTPVGTQYSQHVGRLQEGIVTLKILSQLHCSI